MPVAVALSQWIGVGGCGCPSSRNVSLMILDYFLFKNNALNYTSAANSEKFLSIWHSVHIYSFRWMGYLSCGFHPMKKCLDSRICAYLSDKYDASDWMLSIMLDA